MTKRPGKMSGVHLKMTLSKNRYRHRHRHGHSVKKEREREREREIYGPGRRPALYIFFLDTFCFDFFVFAGSRRLFRNCMSALYCLNFFLFENPYGPLQYSLSRPFSEDWFPEGSLFA